MADWTDRLKEAAYQSPGGTRMIFDYEDVSMSFDKKTAAFNFPDADGTYIQDQGNTGRKFPMRIFFWGENYDQEADQFEAELLSGRGAGILEHPIYGVRNVVPFGPVKRIDKLKTAGNQAEFNITFWETIGVVYPSSQDDPASQVITALGEYNQAAAATLEERTVLKTTGQKATLKGEYQLLLDSVASGLDSIADTQADVEKQFNAVKDSINSSIDVLIGEPLTLAFQSVILIQAPARAKTSILTRLDAYQNLLNTITTQADAVPGFNADSSNKFHSDDLFGQSYISGSILSVMNNQFLTRGDALAAADTLLTQMDELIVWRDDNFLSLSEIDTGEAYQQLLEAVSLAAGFLVQISFTLKQEKARVLASATSMHVLVAELYGSIDDQLDFFISSNDLTGSEIIELPAGREVVYYV